MIKTAWIALGVPLASGICVSAGSASEAEIANGPIRVRLHLPDANTGFYRGTRFDWSGVIGGLEYAGHDYYPPWFQRSDPTVHDFIYDGADIVAGLCTAITGPAEEFVASGKGLSFDQAKAGGTFIKIGVGVLRKPDDDKYGSTTGARERASGSRLTGRCPGLPCGRYGRRSRLNPLST